ncbi:cation diffusion facilitator family transporter [Thermomonas aquatica]|uniref:Cation diffusion facilitator family transporter n=1 Tax=Thermomonas aquatica TaxID=2202149 RepID=A0A5B7ZPP0_9GAMM|nr:cation diffusion facilitator family transporter [Thermomonas aquatica]QDA56436.1 cation diffusion facilitator family transporter [Thermomonas aquatica]
MSGHGDSTKAVLVALGANLAIAVAKGLAAWFTRSGAMLAETVHSLADCGNQVLLLVGMKQAKRPPSPEHPLGRGKEVYFWSFLVAVMLFTIGGMYSLYEGLHKLAHPEPLENWQWAVGVLLFSIAMEAYSTHACLQEAAAERQGRSLWRWFRESRSAELIVVVGENIAALLGLTVALAFIALSIATGNPLWDAVGTLAIGVLLVVVAVFVAIEVKAMLVGQSIDPRRQEEMRRFLEARPEIAALYSLITLQLGTRAMVSVQARMRDDAGIARRIDAIERDFKAAFPEVQWSFFEPEEKDDGEA